MSEFQAVRQAIRDHLSALVGKPDLEIEDGSSADRVDGWDSLVHLKLLSALEEDYDIVFGVDEIEAPANVGELAHLVTQLAGGRS